MGSLCGAVIAVISVMLYHRMEKLLNGMEDVANGKLDVEIPLENSGEYKVTCMTVIIIPDCNCKKI